MNLKLQLVIEDEAGHVHLEDLIQLTKNDQPGYCLGLSLAESRQLLKATQEKIMLNQATAYINLHTMCDKCHQKRRIKGHETYQYRTLFGTVVLPNLRLYYTDGYLSM